MTEDEVRNHAYAMPFHSPAYPPGPYRFFNREFLIITYETDMDVLQKMVPAPLKVIEPIVKFEFIAMPDSAGFGSYTESGQVIPVTFNGEKGHYSHSMFLDDLSPIVGGREIWGFPKKLADPTLNVNKDTLIGTLDYAGQRIVTGTMGYKYKPLDHEKCKQAMAAPNYLLKIIPHVDGSPRICELVRYHLQDIVIKSAWSGPAALELHPHALAPVADLPVRKIISAMHLLTDVTLPYGKVVYDYLG